MKADIRYSEISILPFVLLAASFLLLGCHSNSMKSQASLECEARDAAPRVIVDGPSALTEGQCSRAFRVQVGMGSREVSEGPSVCERQPFFAMPVAEDLVLDLKVSELTAKLYSDRECKHEIDSVKVEKGQSHSFPFYVAPQKKSRSVSSEERVPVTIIAKDKKQRLESDAYSLEVADAQAASFKIWGPQQIQKGACVKYKLFSTDEAGNLAALRKNVLVGLDSVGTRGAQHIYSDPSCSQKKQGISLQPGQSSSEFYFRYDEKNKVHLMTYDKEIESNMRPASLTIYVLSKK